MWGKSTRAAAVVGALLAGLWCATALDVRSSRGDVADLQDRLEKGLKARLPEDFAFIGMVVQLVDTQQLPIDLVDSSFLWVRKNRAHKKYLVPYFERVLRLRAKERGITIP
jgi:hypothetical protein